MSMKSLPGESVVPDSALSRVLSEDILSSIDIPPSDKAAMDGFAVIADDTYGASTSSPVMLRLVGRVDIGKAPNLRVGKGEAAAVATGAQMPEGANAVVMVEFTKYHSSDLVETWDDVHPAENVARAGEDVRKGSIVLRKGTRLLPQDIGMMKYLGLKSVRVVRKPIVAILSTGKELHDEEFSRDKVPDVNRPVLSSAVRELGCEVIDLGVAPDRPEEIKSKLQRGLQSADVTLVTAGTSVGPEDNIPKIIDSLGRPGMLVHGVAIRPSMPTGLAVVNGKPVISLPGYPVSAYIAFIEFLPPLIAHMLGTEPQPTPMARAKLTRRVTGVLGSKTYVRVRAVMKKDGIVADPVRTSGAGILSSLVQANGFVIVPENVEGYEEGDEVIVHLFRPYERENIE
jgi:molybdenum cofactor synthesis domain-containing protein